MSAADWPVALVIGLSAVFLMLVAALFAASIRLVTNNWRLFSTWRSQDREMRVRMALWISVPFLMAGLLWMRGVAVFNFLKVKGIPAGSIFQMLVYMPVILTALAFLFWYVCDRVFPNPAWADRFWIGVVLLALGAGVITTYLTWIMAT